ncbi:MAG TPA: hypothetical protein VG124_14695 [Beijerinckiaceae bacterium]|nr:hypothetical protein [Beijerinckiaceae bacterium]
MRVTKVGDRVILEPLAPTDAMPWDAIDQLGDAPFMPQGREQPRMRPERVVFSR